MSLRDDDTTTVEGVFQCESSSGKAICIKIDGDEVWIPKSCCDHAGGLDRGDPITLEVATWFAEKEGL